MQIRVIRKKSHLFLYISVFLIAFAFTYHQKSYPETMDITFSAKTAESGWVVEKSSETDQSSAFASESSLLNALKIKLNTDLIGGIQYTFHKVNGDWLKWSKDGQILDEDKTASFNAIKVTLYGDVSKKFNILYRIKTKDNKWLDWAKNGAVAGSTTTDNAIIGLQVKVESNSPISKLKKIVSQKANLDTVKDTEPVTTTESIELKPISTTAPTQVTGLQKLEKSIKGIDVSYYNDKIDWAKVKADGIDYAIIQVGYRGKTLGTLKDDKKFEYNIKSAIENDINVGVYYVTQALNAKEAEEEAAYVLKRISDYSITYPVYIDIEEVSGSRQRKLNNAQRTAVCKAFCDKIYAAGYETGIYSCKSYFEDMLNVDELSMYNIWCAAYEIKNKPTTEFEYQIWQCSETGKVNGITGDVDINYCYYDYINYKRGETTTTAAPTDAATATDSPTTTSTPTTDTTTSSTETVPIPNP